MGVDAGAVVGSEAAAVGSGVGCGVGTAVESGAGAITSPPESSGDESGEAVFSVGDFLDFIVPSTVSEGTGDAAAEGIALGLAVGFALIDGLGEAEADGAGAALVPASLTINGFCGAGVLPNATGTITATATAAQTIGITNLCIRKNNSIFFIIPIPYFIYLKLNIPTAKFQHP